MPGRGQSSAEDAYRVVTLSVVAAALSCSHSQRKGRAHLTLLTTFGKELVSVLLYMYSNTPSIHPFTFSSCRLAPHQNGRLEHKNLLRRCQLQARVAGDCSKNTLCGPCSCRGFRSWTPSCPGDLGKLRRKAETKNSFQLLSTFSTQKYENPKR